MNGFVSFQLERATFKSGLLQEHPSQKAIRTMQAVSRTQFILVMLLPFPRQILPCAGSRDAVLSLPVLLGSLACLLTSQMQRAMLALLDRCLLPSPSSTMYPPPPACPPSLLPLPLHPLRGQVERNTLPGRAPLAPATHHGTAPADPAWHGTVQALL